MYSLIDLDDYQYLKREAIRQMTNLDDVKLRRRKIALLLKDKCDIITTLVIILNGYKYFLTIKGPLLYQVKFALLYVSILPSDNEETYRKIIIDSYLKNDYVNSKKIKIVLEKDYIIIGKTNKSLKDVFEALKII